MSASLGAPPRSTRRTSPELVAQGQHDPVSLSLGAMPLSGQHGPGDSPPDSRSYVLGSEYNRGRRRRTTHNTPDERAGGEYDSPKPPQRPYIVGNGSASSASRAPLSSRMARNVSFDVPTEESGDVSVDITAPSSRVQASAAAGRTQPRTSSALVTRTELEMRQDARFIDNAYEDYQPPELASHGRVSPNVPPTGARMHSQIAVR